MMLPLCVPLLQSPAAIACQDAAIDKTLTVQHPLSLGDKTMSEQENTRIVQQSYEHFKSGDIQALLDLYSEDVDFQLPEVENVPFTGAHKGREAVARFFQSLNEAQEVLTFNPQESIAQGDKVV